MSTPLQGTASAATAIERVKYTHDSMIDLVIANPGIQQNAIAKHFGYTPAWVSRIFCSDAFQARLAERKTEIVDPSLVLTVQERLQSVAMKSLDIVLEKLEATGSADMAIKVMDISTRALGYGARADRGVQVTVQNSFVVPLPGKSVDAKAWEGEYGPKGRLPEFDGAALPHTPAPVLEVKPQERELVPAVGGAGMIDVTREVG